MNFLGSIFGGIGLKILTGLAIAAAVAAVLFRAHNAGRSAERVDSMRRTLKHTEERNAVEREVMRIGGDAAVERLHAKWSRD